MKTLFIFGLALLAAYAAFAIPTLTGPTGGFELPTAGIADKGVTVGIDVATSSNGVAWPDTRAEFGCGKHLEFGALYESVQTGSGKTDVWNINGKYQLPLDLGKTRLAVGALYGQGAGSAIFHTWGVYASGTTPLWNTSATATLAYSGNLYHAQFIETKSMAVTSGGTNGFTLGFADEMSLDKNNALGAEVIFGDKTGIFDATAVKTHANLYLAHAFTDNFKTRIAYGGLFQNTGIYLGGEYNFGL